MAIKLRDYQRHSILNSFACWKEGYQSLLLVAATGLGKAQPLYSKVLTPHGFVAMRALREGDQVIGANGQPCLVTGVYPQGIKDVWAVHFSDGTQTHCCDDHLWAVQTRSDKYRRRGYRVWSLAEIKRQGIRTASGERKWFLPVVEPVEFVAQSLPLDPYLLGVLLGDGCLTQSVRLSNPEPYIIDRVRQALPSSVQLRKVEKGCDYQISAIERRGRAGSNPVTMDLRKMGLFGKGSPAKFVPEIYKYNSVAARIALLQGLLDTDGYVHDAGHAEFCSTSRQLADDVCEIVRSLGGCTKVRHKGPASYTYRGKKRVGRESYRIRVNLPFCPLALPRKAARYKVDTKQGRTKAIERIEYVGQHECQCIAVDRPDGLYVTDDYVVTHNTEIFLSLAQAVLQKNPVLRVLILAHRDELIQQPHTRIKQHYPELFPLVGIVKADLNEVDRQIVLASVQTLDRSPERLQQILSHGPINLVITDECHHSVAPSYQGIYKALEAANPAIRHLGVTATPVRADDIGLDAIFETTVPTHDPDLYPYYDLRYGIRKGWLCPIRWLAIKCDVDIRGIRKTAAGELSPAQLRDAIEVAGNFYQTVIDAHREFAPGRRGLVFTAGVEIAHDMARALNEAGITAKAVDGTTPLDERRQALQDFRAGAIELLCSTSSLFGEGLDLPEINVIHMTSMICSDSRYLQCLGRGSRKAPWTDKQDCIAEGSLVLTDQGLIPIENVTRAMKVWDGVEFVAHDGAVCQGHQEVITYAGLTATPEHKVWTDEGWKSFGECAQDSTPIAVTGKGGTAIREVDGLRHYASYAREKEERSLFEDALYDLWQRGSLVEKQCAPGYCGVRQVWASGDAWPGKVDRSQMALSAGAIGLRPLYEPQQYVVSSLWGKRNQVLFCFAARNGGVGHGEFGNVSRDGVGPREQRGSLRARESSLGYPGAEYGEQQESESQYKVSRLPIAVSRCAVCRCNASSFPVGRDDIRGDSGTLLPAVQQAKRRVWDILNAGPRHRFTVGGLLVSNCLVLEYRPLNGRRIVTGGDVLLGKKEAAVIKEHIEQAEEQANGDLQQGLLAGFVFDESGPWLTEGDPLELLAVELHYMNVSPFDIKRQGDVVFIPLGPDRDGQNRTLWVARPRFGQTKTALLLVNQRKSYQDGVRWQTIPASVSIVAEGEYEEIIESATFYAEQWAVPELALRSARWKRDGATDKQVKRLLKLAKNDFTEQEVWDMTKGQVSEWIDFYETRKTLARFGY